MTTCTSTLSLSLSLSLSQASTHRHHPPAIFSPVTPLDELQALNFEKLPRSDRETQASRTSGALDYLISHHLMGPRPPHAARRAPSSRHSRHKPGPRATEQSFQGKVASPRLHCGVSLVQKKILLSMVVVVVVVIVVVSSSSSLVHDSCDMPCPTQKRRWHSGGACLFVLFARNRVSRP
jgi:hypothetical protein